MEDIIEIVYAVDYENHRFLRKSVGKPFNPVASWKTALWDRQSIEPAMLRVPIVLISFILLWSMNLYILERNKMQYLPCISLKYGKFLFSLMNIVHYWRH